MEDRDLGLDLDGEADVEESRLEQALQVPADTEAFCRALKQALTFVAAHPQVEAA